MKHYNKLTKNSVAGVSRSASVVMAFIMKTHRQRYKAAYNAVQSKRQIVLPNESFREQLKQFDRELFGNSSDV